MLYDLDLLHSFGLRSLFTMERSGENLHKTSLTMRSPLSFNTMTIIIALYMTFKLRKKIRKIKIANLSYMATAICVLYFLYHCIAVHRYIKWHQNHVKTIITRAQMKRKNSIKPQNILKYTYDEIVSNEQFNSNMKYFKENKDKRAGFYFTEGKIMDAFSESCTFLGGARAALLQVAHPFIAISVKNHSYIIKKSQINKTKTQRKSDIVDDCNYKSLSKALKLRFNRTFAILFPMLYGPLELSLKCAKKAWTIHGTVHGQLQDVDDDEIIGDGTIFNKDTYYSATMVLPIRWVWSTLCEGSIFIQQMMGIAPYKNLTEEQKEFYHKCYVASANTAMAFGLSKDQIPKTIEEFEEFYFYDMIESGHI
eukprot:56378_1